MSPIMEPLALTKQIGESARGDRSPGPRVHRSAVTVVGPCTARVSECRPGGNSGVLRPHSLKDGPAYLEISQRLVRRAYGSTPRGSQKTDWGSLWGEAVLGEGRPFEHYDRGCHPPFCSDVVASMSRQSTANTRSVACDVPALRRTRPWLSGRCVF
jgi:hypothetical protein